MHTPNELDSFKYLNNFMLTRYLIVLQTPHYRVHTRSVAAVTPLAVVACGLIAVGMIAAIWR